MNKEPRVPAHPILIIDDEPQALDAVEMALYAHGLNHIRTCTDPSRVLELMTGEIFELVLLDLAMPGLRGEELLPKIAETFPEVPVIVVTGFDDVSRAVACIHAGAYDYLVKPVEAEQLVTVINRALERRELARENQRLRGQFTDTGPRNPDQFADIMTMSTEMFRIFGYIESIAITDQPVLITGETGVGKELIARALHRVSGRPGRLVTVNVAGLDEALFADTLFGHDAGAFTGADSQREGLVDRATGGTLFLDEIGDLTPAGQIKLLRLLQEGEFRPLGSDRTQRSTARIVTATTRTIDELRGGNNFRSDLYYRLQTHHIHIPPLRQRKEDIELLTRHFLAEAAGELKKRTPTPPKEFVPLLMNYDFPGNIRELRAMIYNTVARHTSRVLSLHGIHEYLDSRRTPETGEKADNNQLRFPRSLPTIRQATRLLIAEALNRSGGNQSQAARMLGISSQALNQRLKKERDQQKPL